MRQFFLLLVCLFPILSNANITAVTENDPNSFVDGVNVITGDFCLSRQDVVIQGGEPIILGRTYVSQKGKGYSDMFSHLRAFVDAKNQVLEVTEKNGSKLFYQWTSKGSRTDSEKTFYQMDFNKKGVSNTAKGAISGKTNLKNQKIHLYKDLKKFSITSPNGTKRVYVSDKPYAVAEFMDQKNSALKNYTNSYVLIREDLPNGNQIHYEWPKGKKDVWRIRSSDSEGNTYAWAKFHPKYGTHNRSHGDYGVETSDGRHFEYFFFSYKGIHQLKAVRSDENPTEIYTFFRYGKKKMIKSVEFPNNRSKHVSYYTPDDGIKEENPVCFRVKELLSPSTEGNSPIVTHTFIYDIPNKKTTVLDAMGHATDYYWDENLRLIRIDRFINKEQLYNSETFIWGEENSKDSSNLLCKVLFDASRNPISATSYLYDEFGNIQRRQFFGNLTGKGSSLQLNEQGFPIEQSSEVYTHRYGYSKDGKNLLLKEQEDKGLSIEYFYYRDRSLKTREIHYDHGVPQKQKIYKYRDAEPVEEILEDLVGSTRLLKRFCYTEETRRLGLPSSILEMYGTLPEKPEWPMYALFGSEPFLRRTAFSYGKGGRIISKKGLDEDNHCLWERKYRYERGCLVSEIDPYGNSSYSKYDLLGNRIRYKDFGSKSEVHIEYDSCNRPIVFKECTESTTKQASCSYNILGQKEELYDQYQNKTTYLYDRFNQVVETRSPTGAIVRSEYDASGNEITKIDARGNKTTFFYNAYNKPIQIIYPDASSELFYYNTDGTLQTFIDREGVETHFTYDVFERVLSKKVLFKGTLLNEEYWTYDSFNLLSKTDCEGHQIAYEYDAAGRKIAEKRGQESTFYEYDSLGRVYKISSEELILSKEYNLLDQVISEKKQDRNGTLLEVTFYEYDLAGQLLSKTVSVEGKDAVEKTMYDPFKRVIERIDPLGHSTKYIYGEGDHKEVVVDPLGQKTIRAFNAEQKVIHLEKVSADNTTLLKSDYAYDLQGNLIRQESDSRCTLWEYDCMNRVVVLREGANTVEEKTTTYSYNKRGLLFQVTKPSGVVITSEYDLLGRLSKQISSDGSINYTYEYDKNGSLIKSTDENTGLYFTRSYDFKGRLLTETLPLNRTLQREYDKMGRKSALVLPDQSYIVYEYNPLHLKTVSRIKEGITLYSHKYSSYDLSGHVLEEIPIGGMGSVTHHYDLLGRHVSIQSPHFEQELLAFDEVGNLLEESKQNECLSFSYDSSYQLSEEKDHSYSYDSHYNRLSKDKDSFTVNSLNQTSELSYNEDGNPLYWKEKKLSYDALDRLTVVEDSSERVLYGYDSLHRRMYKKTFVLKEGFFELVKQVYYLYDDQNEIGSVDEFGCFIDLRILGSTHSAEIGSAIAIELYGEVYLPIHDLQGNIASIISLATGSLESYQYTAFGEELFSSGVSPWRFASKRIDIETGFVFYGRRFYIPEMGRWLTQDPLGIEAGPNLYAFVSNGPLIHLDLYGLIEGDFMRNPDFLDLNFKYDFTSLDWGRKEFNARQSTPPIIRYTAGSFDLPQGEVFFVNGIRTSLQESKEYGNLLSSYGGGVKVNVLYNQKEGVEGIYRAYTGMIGMRDETSFEIERICRDFYEKNKDNDRRMLWVGHSNGATQIEHAYNNLPKCIRDRCTVIGIAPVSIVSELFCSRSDNFSIKGDIAPYLLAFVHTLIRLSLQDTDLLEGTPYLSRPPGHINELVVLPKDPNTKISSHSFNNPGFQETIQSRLKDFIQSQGGL